MYAKITSVLNKKIIDVEVQFAWQVAFSKLCDPQQSQLMNRKMVQLCKQVTKNPLLHSQMASILLENLRPAIDC